MKSKLGVLVICLLLSGCYSYRTTVAGTGNLKEDVVYKVAITGAKARKGSIRQKNDSTLVLTTATGRKYEVSVAAIEEIKERKFSYLKTIGYPMVSAGIVGGILLLAVPFNMDIGLYSYNRCY